MCAAPPAGAVGAHAHPTGIGSADAWDIGWYAVDAAVPETSSRCIRPIGRYAGDGVPRMPFAGEVPGDPWDQVEDDPSEYPSDDPVCRSE